MVEIRVEVADSDRAHGLIQSLADVFGPASVSFDCARCEVRVRAEWESRSVVRVIDAVESWSAAEGVALPRLLIGDSLQTLSTPVGGQSVPGR